MSSLRSGWLLAILLVIAAGWTGQWAVAQDSETVEDAAPEQHQADCDCEQCATERERDRIRQLKSTHVQSTVFAPEIDGQTANLSTFRVRPDGHLVATVSSSSGDGFVQVYSPDLELTDQFELPFVPTALDLDSSGFMYVAGEGRLAKLDPGGNVVTVSESPAMLGVDLEQLKSELREQLIQQFEANRERISDQLAAFDEMLQEMADKEELTSDDKQQIKLIETQSAKYQSYLDRQSTEVTDAMVQQRLQGNTKITAVAVGDSDVFVASRAKSGSGYEVYRMTPELDEAEKIIQDLRGCCGQMDLHAAGDQVYIAENTKFRVGVYDREGEELSGFGERLNKDNRGFGGCCNPMNVLCCANGDVLTAESSVGKIKRFDADGKLIGYVGKARIGGGCKHVAFGFDEKRDRYFVQHEDENQICVLESRDTVANKPRDPRVAELLSQLSRDKWVLATLAGDRESLDSFAGVGLELEKNDQGQIVVANVIEGSPAAGKNRFARGDIILTVRQATGQPVATEEMTATEVEALIRGSAGTRVMIRYHSMEKDKKRRSSLRRVRMEKVDGKWVAVTGARADVAGWENAGRMKWIRFGPDGTFAAEADGESMIGSPLDGFTWTFTSFDDETLVLEVEDNEEVITWRAKIRFVDTETANISVEYVGMPDSGKFREYRRTSGSGSGDTSASGGNQDG